MTVSPRPLAAIVHNLAQAVAAMRAALAVGAPVLLAGAPGAAATLGAGYFAALLSEARKAVPGVAVDAILDCGAEAGWALAALRAGVPAIAFSGHPEARRALAEIAAQCGARVADYPAGALDLGGEADPAAACRAWLRGA